MKNNKNKGMTAPRCGGGGRYCRSEGDTPGRVQSEHDHEPYEESGEGTARPRGRRVKGRPK